MSLLRHLRAARGFILPLFLALLFRSTCVQGFTIPSGSATPTLVTGDTVVVNKFAYGLSRFSFPLAPGFLHGRLFATPPRRGDMAVFANPKTGVTTIKRIVGLPGDRIQVLAGILYINGTPCARHRDGSFIERDWDDASGQVIAVERYKYQETLPGGVVHAILGMPVQEAEDSGVADTTFAYVVPENHYFGMGDSRDNSADSRFLQELGYIPAENMIGRAEIRLISMEPGAHLWQVWSWPWTFHPSRFFTRIH